MAEPTLALLEHLRNTGMDLGNDFLRESIALPIRLLADGSRGEQADGSERYECSDECMDRRSSYR